MSLPSLTITNMKHLLLLLVLGSALPVLADEPPYSAPATTVAPMLKPEPPAFYSNKSVQILYDYTKAASRNGSTTQAAAEAQMRLSALLVQQNAALMEQNAKIISLLEQIAKK